MQERTDNLVQLKENLNFLMSNQSLKFNFLELDNGKIKSNWFFKASATKRAQLISYLNDVINEVMSNTYTYSFEFLSLFKNWIEQDAQYLSSIGVRVPDLFYRPSIKAQHSTSNNPGQSIHYDTATQTYTAPDDINPHGHGNEAFRIFFSTQWERLKGFVSSLLSMIGIYVFEETTYEEHDYLEKEVYASDQAVSINADEPGYYWIGHASSLITIPINEAQKFHILTDPVEGSLNSLFYPRMTREGKTIEGEFDNRLPRVDVVVISHNHRDHMDEKTLKRLIKQNPILVIPKGDRALFLNMGFSENKIFELNWWEKLSLNTDGAGVQIHAVPTNHWSGRGCCDAHSSAFNGYVIQSNTLQGDIYFPGDTAIMSEMTTVEIFERFNIKTSIQPGGPDEMREDMESTHQCSADALIMHFRLLKDRYLKCYFEDIDSFLDSQSRTKEPITTYYNHTGTFKLGNLRLRDTFYSLNRMIAAFKEDKEWRRYNLKPFEFYVHKEIKKITKTMQFKNQKILSNKHIAEEIIHNVHIPKIGEYFSLVSPLEKKEGFSYRNLITNKRALIDYDKTTRNYLNQLKKSDPIELKVIFKHLFETYNHGWARSFTITKKTIESLEQCNTIDDYLDVIKRIERKTYRSLNVNGHMSAVINYSKWLIENGDNKKYLTGFFYCQKVDRIVNSQLGKQGIFQQLAKNLAKSEFTVKAYNQKINVWTSQSSFFSTDHEEQLNNKNYIPSLKKLISSLD